MMSSQSISVPEQLMLFTQKIIEEQKFESSDITVNITSLCPPEEYRHFKFMVRIAQEGRDDLNLFAKITELDDNYLKNIKIKHFEKERLFYTTLMKAYRQLEDKHEVPEEHRLKVPACYGAEAAHKREILVLEELTSKGYGSASRTESVNWQYAAAAITELAKFHTLSLAYQKENPTEFDNFSKQLPAGLLEKDKESRSLFASLTSLAVSTVRDENKGKLKSFLKSQDLTAFNEILKPLDRQVIVHAYFWPKSMMHKVLDDGTVEVITVEYCGIQVGSPVTDLLHFIYTATDAPFRESHYQALVRYYQAELTKAASRLRLDIKQEYSYEYLEYEMTEKLSYGLLSAVMYLPVLSMGNRTDEPQGPTDEDTRIMKSAEMYSRRLNEVVDAYARTPILAEQPSKGRTCGMCFLC